VIPCSAAAAATRDDEQALTILRAIRAAIPDNGRLLLVEAIIPDDDSPHLAKDLDIRLISILPGGGRTEPEYARLLSQAGFRPEPASGLTGNDSVIAAVPAS
jgi:O-methyltransferase domain